MAASAQTAGTAFTYQGQLKEDGVPVSATCDFEFSLWDDPTNGDPPHQIGATLTFTGPDALDVSNGLFSAPLDFGGGVFTGEARWLEIAVRCPGGDGIYSILDPRQELTPAPYASTALTTVGLDGHSLDAADGSPKDAVYVDVGGKVRLDEGGLMVFDQVGHGVTFYSDSFTFGEGMSEDPVYDYSASSDTHNFWTEGSRKMVINANGNVGIGTTAPTYPLHVGGNAGFDADVWFNSPTRFEIAHLSNTGLVIDPENLKLQLEVDNSKIMTVTDSAVGIGTASPHNRLTVAGNLQVTDGDILLGTEGRDAYISLSSDQAADATEMHIKSLDNVGFAVTDKLDNTRFVIDTLGRVGIGTTSPTQPLEVGGTAKVQGFQLGSSATPGHVLTADASGKGTWQPAGSGSSLWSASGSDIFYDGGNVGVGVADPMTTLHVAGKVSDAVSGEGDLKIGDDVDSLKLSISSSVGRVFASGVGQLQLGAQTSPILTLYSNGVSINGAINDHALNVNGTVRMNGFKMATGATSGHVLTTDSTGLATWQPPPTGGGDFTLPVDETVDADAQVALRITNTGTGSGTYGLRADINNAGSTEAAAAYFNVDGSGMAVQAQSDSGTTVYASNSGSGRAFYGTTGGSGGGEFRSTMNGGYGVKGRATNTGTSSNTTGGWFESSGFNGRGVYASATGAYGAAVVAEASGGEGYGVKADASWVGIEATGAYAAARFYGDVHVYEHGTFNSLLKVNDTTGVTSVRVLQIEGGSDLAENFDVTGNAEPGMVVEIDPQCPGKLRIARGAYNRRVAGVISGANDLAAGMVLADLPGATNSQPIALTGRVWVHCDATEHSIELGDLLTTAERPGYAMAVTNHDRASGAVIGKAMSRLAKGQTGMVLVLVNLQ